MTAIPRSCAECKSQGPQVGSYDYEEEEQAAGGYPSRSQLCAGRGRLRQGPTREPRQDDVLLWIQGKREGFRHVREAQCGNSGTACCNMSATCHNCVTSCGGGA